MPIAAIPLDELNQRLPEVLSTERLEAYLEQLGCDIEGFTQIRRIRCQSCHNLQELTLQEELPGTCPECLHEAAASALWDILGEVDVVRMDLLPVRPDIFDPGGLSRAIRGLMDHETGLASYPVKPATLSLEIGPQVAAKSSYRPVIACAVLRGLQVDELGLRMVMKLQENLHWAIGRDRKLASIGVYDLATLQGPLRYDAVAPDSHGFVPLQSADGVVLTPAQILEKHPKGIAYQHLLAGFSHFPMLLDANEQVLSMPPIINSHATRMTTATTELFIDVTGMSERIVHKTLHILLTSMCELFPSAVPEQVELKSAEGTQLTPTMATESFQISVAAATKLLGISLDRPQAAKLMSQMRHHVEESPDNPDTLALTVAPYRNDIMHEVDLIEDLAIAYDYLKIVPTLVPTMTLPQPRPERVLAGRTRDALVGLGFFESMSLMLSHPEEQYALLGLEDPHDAVLLANPISVEQTLLRTSLLPQLLKLFAINRGQGLPQRLFEVDDVVRRGDGPHDHPIESLHAVAGILDSEVGFADIKGIYEALVREVGLSQQKPMHLEAASHPAMIPGRCARIYHGQDAIGWLGEIHPAVLERLRLAHPIAALEIDLSPFLPAGWNAAAFV